MFIVIIMIIILYIVLQCLLCHFTSPERASENIEMYTTNGVVVQVIPNDEIIIDVIDV